MVRRKKSWSRVIAAAAVACGCLSALGSIAARAEENPARNSVAGSGTAASSAASIPGPFAIQNDGAIEPASPFARLNVPGPAGREMLWDLAARASAANEPRFQRAFFLSAHMRF